MTTLTATQLRNARKRRAKKKNQSASPGVTSSGGDVAAPKGNDSAMIVKREEFPVNAGKKRQRTDDKASDHDGRNRNSKSGVGRRSSVVDPSQRYSSHPLRAPIVQRAQRFFDDLFRKSPPTLNLNVSLEDTTIMSATGATHQNSTDANAAKFPIYIGPTYGWRTVVKLPVRNSITRTTSHSHPTPTHHPENRRSVITIGLFAPGSHAIVPIVAVGTDETTTCLCQTHHPVINQAIIHIQQAARSLQQRQGSTAKTTTSDPNLLTAFSEDTGQGYLRHIALSIERHTSRIQLVVVWNSLPPPSNYCYRINNNSDDSDENDVDVGHTVLTQFLKALLQIKTRTATNNDAPLQWHSIWIHYNNAWKHANAIFTHDGAWKLLYHHLEEVATAATLTEDLVGPNGGITEYLVAPNDGDATEPTMHQLPHVPLHFPPQVFRQGNITAFTKIVQSIRNIIIHQFYPNVLQNSNDITQLKNRPSCLELYGGVGTIGLHIADLCSNFICSDENPYNVQCFNASVKAIMASRKSKTGPSIRYESASAAAMVLDRMEHINNAIDIIIVDPPRKGMGADVCHALTTSLPPPTSTKAMSHGNAPQTTNGRRQRQQQVLIYVSCGFDAFVRDYEILTHSSVPSSSSSPLSKTKSSTASNVASRHPWTLVHAEGHVLFPGSDAIETLAILTREKHPTRNG